MNKNYRSVNLSKNCNKMNNYNFEVLKTSSIFGAVQSKKYLCVYLSVVS